MRAIALDGDLRKIVGDAPQPRVDNERLFTLSEAVHHMFDKGYSFVFRNDVMGPVSPDVIEVEFRTACGCSKRAVMPSQRLEQRIRVPMYHGAKVTLDCPDAMSQAIVTIREFTFDGFEHTRVDPCAGLPFGGHRRVAIFRERG